MSYGCPLQQLWRKSIQQPLLQSARGVRGGLAHVGNDKIIGTVASAAMPARHLDEAAERHLRELPAAAKENEKNN